ncbi:MAG: ATP-binding cassette domain-containing protein [Deltaproteobacteria bacterium]|nr:ATP-binding cassette domain-containing protein [Deltaproteobacteria bacterium]
MIEVNGISKSYGPTKAVQDISFSVQKGDVLGFLGPNGAGKSTTMRILTCYLTPDGGTASIAGHEIGTSPIEVQKRIGYLPENTPLYMDMGVVDYLTFIARMRSIPGSAIKQHISRAIEICGLGPIVSKDIGELSKGFRQRVGLAQALIHDPDVLILDEPTIGLDPSQIIEIRNLIKSIGKEKTVILSSHILPEVSATCDRVLIINKGAIVGSGTPEELASMSRGGQTLMVRIRGPRDEITHKLQALGSFSDITHLEELDGLNRFELQSDAAEDLSEAVFHTAAQSGWSLAELYRKTINLEDVFLELTTGENPS